MILMFRESILQSRRLMKLFGTLTPSPTRQMAGDSNSVHFHLIYNRHEYAYAAKNRKYWYIIRSDLRKFQTNKGNILWFSFVGGFAILPLLNAANEWEWDESYYILDIVNFIQNAWNPKQVNA